MMRVFYPFLSFFFSFSFSSFRAAPHSLFCQCHNTFTSFCLFKQTKQEFPNTLIDYNWDWIDYCGSVVIHWC
ncbi:unnamed protein product [Lathyrus sativus]|nr:unnamed protein product [Lathyrus sativus]